MPTAPVPANRSRKLAPTCFSPRILNNAARALSVKGRTPQPTFGDFKILPLAFPAITRTFRILFYQQFCFFSCLKKQFFVLNYISHPKLWQTRLADTQKVAWPPKFK